MHPEHKKLLAEIKRHSGNGTSHSNNDSYISSGHIYYDVSVPVRRQIAKDWLKTHTDLPFTEFIALLDSLYQGKSHEEKTIASILVGYHQAHRKQVTPKHLNLWLDELVGWAEVDSLCQSVFSAEEVLGHWTLWKRFIEKLSKDTNINKRRASLVLLTGPVRQSDDVRLRELAFATIDRVKHEKEILITKAISWLLRDMVQNHRKEVVAYLKQNTETLPKIALRETRRKIETGRK